MLVRNDRRTVTLVLSLVLALPASAARPAGPAGPPAQARTATVAAPARIQTPDEGGKRPGLKQYNLGKHGLALEGYDPVAYFPEGGGKPAKGKAELSLTVRGVTYRFATKEHLELFEARPEQFEPAYGGWCAYAMSDGRKVSVDPESYLIEDGRLLLFYKSFFSNTRKKWKKEGGDKLRPKADAAWKKIVTPPKPER